jgi:hypothetical protein
MSLDFAACAAAINDRYQNAITFPRTGDYPSEFAGAYEDYAKAGVVNGAVNSGGAFAIIESALRRAPLTPEELGTAFAEYWATIALAPEPPNLSVTNNAVAVTPAFIEAVRKSIRDTRSVPFFEEFIENVEAAAKTITWVIVPPPPNPPFTSGVS